MTALAVDRVLIELQFGLDAVVEENATPSTPTAAARSAGFNSASTLSSRRTRRFPDWSDNNRRLQFGLDAVVEENLALLNWATGLKVLQFGLDAVVEENRTTPAAVGGPVSLLPFGLDAVVEEHDAAPLAMLAVSDPAFSSTTAPRPK